MFRFLGNLIGNKVSLALLGIGIAFIVLATGGRAKVTGIALTGSEEIGPRMFLGVLGIVSIALGIFLNMVEFDLPIGRIPLSRILPPIRRYFSPPPSHSASIDKALVQLRGLTSLNRVKALKVLEPSLPNNINGKDAARLLGNLSSINRLSGIKILAPKLSRDIDDKEMKLILDNLHARNRTDAIKILEHR